ncbi:MAG: hypothetical protein E7262_06260 [Lachnospiraceae bacterium]|nr:hypothetical protein [Lachnospiraceae bacterium]
MKKNRVGSKNTTIDKSNDQEINNISDDLQKNYKVVNNFSWRLVIFTMVVSFISIIFVIAYDAYVIKSNQLKVEAHNINNAINEEFSVVVNSINMNGYLTIFEQYLKTTSGVEEITSTVYYEDAVKTLNTMSLISEEIENVFIVSFNNKSVLYSGISNAYTTDFVYENQPWYNYNVIKQNRAYLSDEYEIEGFEGKLFGIVRPIFDSMSDEPLGVLVYSFNKEYLDNVFYESSRINQSESVIRIDEGKILYSTVDITEDIEDEAFVENYIVNNKNILYGLDNENLNWNVITYCGIKDILLNSLNQFMIVTALFILILLSFNAFIKKLKVMKVIRSRRELKKIIDLNKIQEEPIENAIEDVDVDTFEEMPIEEVLATNEYVHINNVEAIKEIHDNVYHSESEIDDIYGQEAESVNNTLKSKNDNEQLESIEKTSRDFQNDENRQEDTIQQKNLLDDKIQQENLLDHKIQLEAGLDEEKQDIVQDIEFQQNEMSEEELIASVDEREGDEITKEKLEETIFKLEGLLDKNNEGENTENVGEDIQE